MGHRAGDGVGGADEPRTGGGRISGSRHRRAGATHDEFDVERARETRPVAGEGLADDDEWQIKDPSQAYDKRRLRELDFWFGATTVTGADLDR